jgi:transcriptional regulator with XRE-family HTH domain
VNTLIRGWLVDTKFRIFSEVRKKKGLSLADLSVKANVPEETILKFETGINPKEADVFEIGRVCEALDLKLKDVIDAYSTDLRPVA